MARNFLKKCRRYARTGIIGDNLGAMIVDSQGIVRSQLIRGNNKIDTFQAEETSRRNFEHNYNS